MLFISHIRTLIISAVMMLAAFLALVCGLILDTNVVNSRKNFEVQMNIIRMMFNHDNR
jgi:hypothetical protein